VRNLPTYSRGRSKEESLVIQFAKAYRDQFTSVHNRTIKTALAMARQIPVNGFGITDFVAISWNDGLLGADEELLDPEEFLRRMKPTTRAFEVKLADWRKALMQANRYRFFAHVPIVVLPIDRTRPALEYLETFELLGVGLWSFATETKRIIRHYTPRPLSPRDRRHEIQALRHVARASKALPIL
jgi:hypothetical protein